MTIHNPPVTTDQRDAAFVQVGFINAVQPLYIGIATLFQRRPVMAGQRNIKAIVFGQLRVVHVARRIPHDFFWHATNIDASAAQRGTFNNRCLCAILGCTLGMCQPTTATADDNQIKILTHPSFLSCFSGPNLVR